MLAAINEIVSDVPQRQDAAKRAKQSQRRRRVLQRGARRQKERVIDGRIDQADRARTTSP